MSLSTHTFKQQIIKGGQQTVFFDKQSPIAWQALAQDIGRWYEFWLTTEGTHWALYHSDIYTFTAALLAAWWARKTIYLPGDGLQATARHLQQHVDGWVGEFDHNNCLKGPINHRVTTDSTINTVDLDPEFDPQTQLYFFTSGSTGTPTPIAKTWSQVITEVNTLHTLWGQQLAGQPVYASVAHQHFYGFIFRWIWPLLSARPIAREMLAFPETLIKCAQQPFTFVSSPAFLSRLTPDTDWAQLPHRITRLFSAGGALSTQHAQQVQRSWSVDPTEIYGSTETGVIGYKERHKTQESFQAFPEISLSVNDEQLLEVKSPFLPEDTPSMTMSDRAKIHANGQFSLLGRADRIVKIEEKRVSLTQMELTLNATPWINQSYVLPLQQGASQRQVLVAVIVLSKQGVASLAHEGRLRFNQQLKSELLKSFERITLPKRWRYVPQIPTNPQGKTELNQMNRLFDDNTSKVTQPIISHVEQTPDEVTLTIVVPTDLHYLKGHFPNHPITPGVVQVDWAKAWADQYFKPAGHMMRISQLKFTHVIAPEVAITAKLVRKSEHQVQFSYTSEHGTHASGILNWSTEATVDEGV